MKIIDERRTKTIDFESLDYGECCLVDDGILVMKIEETDLITAICLSNGKPCYILCDEQVIPIEATISYR